jgi:hypothetical protein
MFGRRRDGTLAQVSPERRILPFLMPTKAESVVYFEQRLDLTRTAPWLAAYAERTGRKVTVFHLVLHGLARMLRERPHLNRFVAGRRIYDRRGIFMSFVAKKAMRDGAPLATIKRRFDDGEGFDAMVAALTTEIGAARTDALTKVDKELAFFLKLPAPLLALGVRLLRRLDAWGLAPHALIGDDPMYTSVFLANLGSIKLDAAYHHLFEYGNCPLFVTLGQVAPAPIVVGDQLEVRPQLVLRYTYDERIEDGFYCATALERLRGWVEDPASWLMAPAPPSAL